MGLALNQRLRQIPQHCGNAQHNAERPSQIPGHPHWQGDKQQRSCNRKNQATKDPLPGFTRTDLRSKFVTPKEMASKKCASIKTPRPAKHRKEPPETITQANLETAQ